MWPSSGAMVGCASRFTLGPGEGIGSAHMGARDHPYVFVYLVAHPLTIALWLRHATTRCRTFNAHVTSAPAQRMTSTTLIVTVVVLAGLVAAWLVSRQRRKDLLKSIRAAWGQPRAVQSLDDSWTSQAWRTLHGNDAAAHSQTQSNTHSQVPPNALPYALSPARSYAIDERTWNDLDLDRVVATLDRSHCALGRQRLYQRLRTGEAWPETPWLETVALQCSTDTSFRESLALILARAGGTLGPGLWSLTVPGSIVVRPWYWCLPLLTTAMIVSIVAIAFYPAAILAVALIALTNMALRSLAGWQVPGLLEPLRQLTPLLTTARRLEAVPALPLLAKTGVRERIETLLPLERIGQWVSRDPHATNELVASLWEYLNVLLLLDANALLIAGRVLDRSAHTLREIAEWVGDVDCALTVASLRAEPRAWSHASQRVQHNTTLSQVWHPLVEHPVANDVELEPGEGLILTGANMTGKSTYLRAVGIALVLAHALDTCPASSCLGRVWRVRSLIGRSDDLATGTSYYFAEAKRIVELLHDVETQPPTVFLLDELLRGTNTIERLAAGESVLRGLLAPSTTDSATHSETALASHAVIVATHDGELVTRLCDCYRAWHFRESTDNGTLSFDFQRRSGPSTTRTAIALLALSGAPDAVVSLAHALAEADDKTTPGAWIVER